MHPVWQDRPQKECTVSVHYDRSVMFVIGTANVAVLPNPATSTVGQVAKTPGGIGPEAAVISGSVVKLGSPSSVDVVNVNGGGVYTIQVPIPLVWPSSNC
jgi:hypothetical protein